MSLSELIGNTQQLLSAVDPVLPFGTRFSTVGMGQLAGELYSAHQAAGNGQRDFSSVLEALQDK